MLQSPLSSVSSRRTPRLMRRCETYCPRNHAKTLSPLRPCASRTSGNRGVLVRPRPRHQSGEVQTHALFGRLKLGGISVSKGRIVLYPNLPLGFPLPLGSYMHTIDGRAAGVCRRFGSDGYCSKWQNPPLSVPLPFPARGDRPSIIISGIPLIAPIVSNDVPLGLMARFG
jgi:hypothetical protein